VWIEGHDIDRLGWSGIRWRLAIHVRTKIPTVLVQLDERLLSVKSAADLIEVVSGVADRSRSGLDVLRKEVEPDPGHRDDAEDTDHDNRDDDPDPRLDPTGHWSS